MLGPKVTIIVIQRRKYHNSTMESGHLQQVHRRGGGSGDGVFVRGSRSVSQSRAGFRSGAVFFTLSGKVG